MSDLKADFAQAQKDIKTLTERPGNDDMLALYALYKQATEGDVSGDKPSMFDFVARAKYEAWSKLEGTLKEAAMQQYVDKVTDLLAG